MYEASTKEVIFERERLQLELDREGIGIKLLVGREYFLDEFLLDFIKQPLLLEGTNCIMIEISSHTPVDLIKDTLFAISRGGYIPYIAHPERCRLLELPVNGTNRQGAWKTWFSRGRGDGNENEPGNELLDYLKRLGCRFQANLGSFNGQYGERVRTNARYLEKTGTYTHSGTDAHSPDTVKAIFGLP
jgi:protein-tyrosine phosphatase